MTTFKLNTKVLDGMQKNLELNVNKAVAKSAFLVEGRAKIKAPVDTGALRASIYVSMSGLNEGASAMAEAQGRRPEAIIVPLPVPKDNHTAHIGPSVEYGLAVEVGSARRSGTPYLQPAFRETEEDIKRLLKEAIGG